MKTDYKKILKSPHWFEKRKIILARDDVNVIPENLEP